MMAPMRAPRDLGRQLVPLFVVVVASVAARAQQATWFLRGGGADVHLVGSGPATLRGLAPAPVATEAGEWVVHFGADALGKPGSLPLEVPAGAVVHVAVEPAAAPARRTVALDDPTWRTAGAAHWLDAGGEHDYCVVAQATPGTAGVFGVIARWVDPRQHYRFVWDLGRAELRLERLLGDEPLVLARRPAPAPDGAIHALSLQVQGFRLQAFLDDAPMLQVLDGAIGRGGFGRWDSEQAARWTAFSAMPPMVARASGAAVATPGQVRLTAATTCAAGHWSVVELSLDRPHPLVPTTAEGLEPWLLQRPAAPQVLLGDWAGSLGPGAVAGIARDGLAGAELLWPQVPGVRLQAVLARMVLVTADGCEVAGRTPPVPLWL